METIKKKRGPAPGPPTVRTTVMLEPDLVQWGKEQPGGLSELVRRLLRQAQQKQERTAARRANEHSSD